MAVTYHAGRRIQGTQADFDGIPAVQGGWKELGRTTLGSINDYVQVSSLPDKRYYMVLSDLVGNGSGVNLFKRVGNSGLDTGSNYANRYSNSGGADATTTSQTSLNFGFGGVGSNPTFSVDYWANLPNKEKLMISYLNHQFTAGAGTAPSRGEVASKWANTTNPITDIAAWNSGSDDWAVGSEVVVLGWDPDDTHTDNFWEELASVSGSDDVGDDFDTGVFTAKKYLWIQGWLMSDQGASTVNPYLRLGNTTIDSGSNYSYRYSVNGATDVTVTSTDKISRIALGSMNASDEAIFFNVFIINNASNEKLMIMHTVDNLVGTGAATAPRRSEQVGKWTNTSNQCDIIGIHNAGTGNITYRELKVWGAD